MEVGLARSRWPGAGLRRDEPRLVIDIVTSTR
jgi:hypothetical protein